MALTYIIQSPAYDKNVGGFCALHYLADRLIALGAKEVYLTTDVLNPRWQAKTINLDKPFFLGNSSSVKRILYKSDNSLLFIIIFFKSEKFIYQKRSEHW